MDDLAVVKKGVERWRLLSDKIQSNKTATAFWSIVVFSFGVYGFFWGDTPWEVIQKLWALAYPMLTFSNAMYLGLMIVWAILAFSLVSGYYEQRTKALESEGRVRDIRGELGEASLRLTLSKSDLEDARQAVTERENQITELERKIAAHPNEIAAYKQMAHESNRAWSSIAFQQLVMTGQREGWGNPTITLRWIENEDTMLVDEMAAYIRQLAPDWPIKKVRDPGSELRQEGMQRIRFESSNTQLVNTMSFCFSRARWVGELTEWHQGNDPNVIVTVYPKRVDS